MQQTKEYVAVLKRKDTRRAINNNIDLAMKLLSVRIEAPAFRLMEVVIFFFEVFTSFTQFGLTFLMAQSIGLEDIKHAFFAPSNRKEAGPKIEVISNFNRKFFKEKLNLGAAGLAFGNGAQSLERLIPSLFIDGVGDGLSNALILSTFSGLLLALPNSL
ncbi:hypothetical protein FGO68_gene12982 [Halteria grandinella]|uniref:Uncharacterized protein n=1 Tax=Halteria grandinella TaxID=5974 RepID=A0A8J8NPX1_HALGN|nr:hypothetical protein FGO68_gene12982 [Halteria grandinella]